MTNACWVWPQERRFPLGYGRIWENGRFRYAHRWVYERLVGCIPHGLEIDHLCRNKGCVNPEHLEPVTHLENMQRTAIHPQRLPLSTREACPHGHPYTPENTYVTVQGFPTCRTCHAIRERQRRLATRKMRKIPMRGVES